MEETAYKQWWPLHRRAALGEPLSAEEQARYKAGLRQLEAAEQIDFDMVALERLREQIKQAEAERQRLQQRYEAMQAEIAMLEPRRRV